MNLFILFLLSIIYLKSFPVLIYDSSPTVLFAVISALAIVAICIGFNSHTSSAVAKWANTPRGKRSLLPRGYLTATLIATLVSVALIYLTAIGFSSRFANRADLIDPYMDELIVFSIFAVAPTLSHCVTHLFGIMGMSKFLDDQ